VTARPAGPGVRHNSRRGSTPGASRGSRLRRTSIAALRPIAAPGPAQVCTGTPHGHPGRQPDQSPRPGRTTGATDTGLLSTRSDGCLIADLYNHHRPHRGLGLATPQGQRQLEPIACAGTGDGIGGTCSAVCCTNTTRPRHESRFVHPSGSSMQCAITQRPGMTQLSPPRACPALVTGVWAARVAVWQPVLIRVGPGCSASGTT
jgi:hypothetical protein